MLQIRQQDFRQHPMASLGQMYSIHRHAPGAVLFCRGIKTLLNGNAGKAGSRTISLHLRSPGAKQLTKRIQSGTPGQQLFWHRKEKRLDYDDPMAAGGDQPAQQ